MKNKMLDDYWTILCQIHILTKKYYILSEEINLHMATLVQPIKEQRDALEHIIRVYSALTLEDDSIVEKFSNVSIDEYVRSNMEKAIGHEYRAFFDAIDYITISIRERIYNEINNYSLKQIINVFPDYEDFKKRLNELPEEIANMRIKKDVAGNMLEIAREYAQLADELLSLYKKLSKAVCRIETNKKKVVRVVNVNKKNAVKIANINKKMIAEPKVDSVEILKPEVKLTFRKNGRVCKEIVTSSRVNKEKRSRILKTLVINPEINKAMTAKKARINKKVVKKCE